MADSTLVHELVRLCDEIKVPIDDDEASLHVSYLEAIYHENESLNLTTIPFGKDALVLHVVDSLAAFRLREFKTTLNTSIVDIGSGGGFPGVPVGIHTYADVSLIDSVAKKMDAVGRALSAVGLNERIHTNSCRIEEFAHKHRDQFDYCTARAVAPLEVLLEYACPLLRLGGYFIAFKSTLSSEELSFGTQVGTHLGFENVSRETFELPDTYGTREVLVFQKNSVPDIKLPRRVGQAKKRPLSKVFHMKQ